MLHSIEVTGNGVQGTLDAQESKFSSFSSFGNEGEAEGRLSPEPKGEF